MQVPGAPNEDVTKGDKAVRVSVYEVVREHLNGSTSANARAHNVKN